jgi:isopenicillin N synthase-like dioxygenase
LKIAHQGSILPNPLACTERRSYAKDAVNYKALAKEFVVSLLGSFQKMKLDAFVDISPLLDENSTIDDKQQTAELMHKYCTEFGFFYICSDKINWETIQKTFEQAKRYFSISTHEQKEELSMKKHGQHRGYLAVGDENVDDTATVTQVLDVKEGFDIGLDTIHYTKDHEFSRAKNRWPSYMTQEWQHEMENYFSLLLRIGKALLHGFALALKLPMTHFDQLFTEPLALMRMLHYPALQTYPPNSQDKIYLGAGEHTDYGCITILLQDTNNDGLEIQHNKEWISVPPIEKTLVVNIGDALEVWTNGLYKATTHRVVMKQENMTKERYSIPFFFEPNYETKLEKIIDHDSGENYAAQGMQFGDYLSQRLTSTFSYRKVSL